MKSGSARIFCRNYVLFFTKKFIKFDGDCLKNVYFQDIVTKAVRVLCRSTIKIMVTRRSNFEQFISPFFLHNQSLRTCGEFCFML